MSCLALIVSALLICPNVLGDPVGVEPSRDVESRMEELEGRDRHQQTELDELRQQNLAVLEEVKRLIERDKQQARRIAVLEDREHAYVQRESQNVAIESEVEILKKREAMHAGRIEVLERRVQTLTETVAVLIGASHDGAVEQHNKDDNETDQPLTAEYEDIKGVVQTLSDPETTIDELDETISHMGTPLDDDRGGINLEANQPTKKQSPEVRQINEGVPVAFFATMTNHTYHLGYHQAIPFDHAITNVGNGYHTTSGYFYAPVSGIYVFSATIFISQQTASFEYAVNGRFMSRMFTDSGSEYETTSQTAIFNLSQGDEVVVRNVNTDIWVNGNHFNSFSGFLLSNSPVSQVVG